MSESTTIERTVPRLKQRYHDEIKSRLQQQLGLDNVMQVPRLEKIVINMGVGRATQQPSLLAVVTIVMSIPRWVSTLSTLISGNTVWSLRPNV